MNKISETFRAEIVKELINKADDWSLSEIEAGKDEILVSARVDGIHSDMHTPHPLVIQRRCDFLKIEARQITRLGNPGLISNRTVANLLRQLFHDGLDADDDKVPDQVMLLQMLSHQYLTSPRVAEDLLAAVIEGSNNTTTFTRACKDARDGEVYVSSAIYCDFEQIPAVFGDAVASTLHHGAIVGRFVRIMRELILPDDGSGRERAAMIHAIAEAGEKKRNPKTKKEKPSEMEL